MSIVPESARRNSVFFALYGAVAARVQFAVENSWLSDPLQGLVYRWNGFSSVEDPIDEETTSQSPRSATTVRSNSLVVAVMSRMQAWTVQSWLYSWLTAEPEPEVIVIDLRETLIVGRVLAVLDWGMREADRELRPALPTATVTRVWYRVQNRLERRPIQVMSMVLVAVVNIALLASLFGGAAILSAQTFVFFALLILGGRGLMSTMTWEELTQTGVYQVSRDALVAAFEPPEPPEREWSQPDDESQGQQETDEE